MGGGAGAQKEPAVTQQSSTVSQQSAGQRTGAGAGSAAAAPSATPEQDPAVDEALAVLNRAVEKAKKAVADADAVTARREDAYIAATWAHGNLMRGWDGYCRRVDRAPAPGNGSGTATGAPKQRKVRPSDRMFSMVSSTSAIRMEGVGNDAGARKGGVQKQKKKKR